MSLKDELSEAMKTAMRKGDKMELSAIRLLRSEIRNKEIDIGRDIDDEEIVALISKGIKKCQEAIEQFKRGNRSDLVEKEEKEIETLRRFLPRQLTEDELKDIVTQTIEEVGADSPKDLGRVMAAIMPKIRGRAEGKIVSKMVRETLKETF